MAFEPFDLGRVIQSAETIKSLRRQSVTDGLRDQYLQTNIANAQQAGQFAQQNQAAEVDARTARQRYMEADYIERAQDPVATATELVPELVQQYEAKNGAGSFQQLHPDQVRAIVGQAKVKAASIAGIAPDRMTAFQQAQIDVQRDQLKKKDELTPYQKESLSLERQKLAQGSSGEGTNKQLITRPVGSAGLVQDFAWNPKTNKREPNGEPYRPVTALQGNVTEGERKAAALGTRLESSMQALNEIEQQAPGASRPGLIERGLESVGMEAGANMVRSSERQQADTAQLDALDAALTLATGAAYTREQLQNLRKSYFPQIGDSDAQVEAKRKRFGTIVETARIAAGRASPSIDKAMAKSNGASGKWTVEKVP